MKKEQEELTIWGKIELFFRDLFMMPSRDGQRRFIKNIFTGKNQWTRGSEPFVTTKEEITYTPPVSKETEVNLSPRKQSFFYEPFHSSRWIFEFPELKNYVIRSLRAYGNETMCIEVIMIIDTNLTNTLEKFFQMAIQGNGKLRKNAVLQLLDPTGVVIDSYVYRNVEIQDVEMLESFSYENDDILTAKITFSHQIRKRVESPEDLAENIFEEEELLYEMNGEDMDKMDAYYRPVTHAEENNISEYMKETPQEVVAEFKINEKTGEITGGLTKRKKRGPYKKRVPKDKKTTKKIVVKTKKAPLIKPKKRK